MPKSKKKEAVMARSRPVRAKQPAGPEAPGVIEEPLESQGEVIYRERVGVEPGYADEFERHKKIKIKAYELFTQRGYIPGDDLRDWFTAEQMIEEEERRGP